MNKYILCAAAALIVTTSALAQTQTISGGTTVSSVFGNNVQNPGSNAATYDPQRLSQEERDLHNLENMRDQDLRTNLLDDAKNMQEAIDKEKAIIAQQMDARRNSPATLPMNPAMPRQKNVWCTQRSEHFGTGMIPSVQARANQGMASSQATLGRLYELGTGTNGTPDYGQAAQWYRRAADQGDVDGQSRLGGLYPERQRRAAELCRCRYYWTALAMREPA